MVFTCFFKQEILVPKELPSGDVLGNRNTNEITSLSFNYTVSNYIEATIQEDGHWLFEELADLILSQYTSSTGFADSSFSLSSLFGGASSSKPSAIQSAKKASQSAINKLKK